MVKMHMWTRDELIGRLHASVGVGGSVKLCRFVSPVSLPEQLSSIGGVCHLSCFSCCVIYLVFLCCIVCLALMWACYIDRALLW